MFVGTLQKYMCPDKFINTFLSTKNRSLLFDCFYCCLIKMSLSDHHFWNDIIPWLQLFHIWSETNGNFLYCKEMQQRCCFFLEIPQKATETVKMAAFDQTSLHQHSDVAASWYSQSTLNQNLLFKNATAILGGLGVR